MNRFRMMEKLKRNLRNLERDVPVNFFLLGSTGEEKGHFFEVLPYLEAHTEGYLIQYYMVEVTFGNGMINIQTYHMNQDFTRAKYIQDEEMDDKSISNRMYARVKYLEKSKGYQILKTAGNDRLDIKNIPVLSGGSCDKSLTRDQVLGFDLNFSFSSEDDVISISEERKPLFDIKIKRRDKPSILIGGRILEKYETMDEKIFEEYFLPTLLGNPTVETYRDFLNLHNPSSHLYLKDTLLYNVYKVYLEEFFFGPDSVPQDNEEDVLTPMDKYEEESTFRMPCAYSNGYNDGTPVGSLVNPDTGEEIKIVANSTSIVRQENPGNIFRDHLEKGPLKDTMIPAKERASTEDEDEYPYSVEGISYGFKTEMEADLFELLLDDIAQLGISEKVKVLKYIKNLKISKEDK